MEYEICKPVLEDRLWEFEQEIKKMEITKREIGETIKSLKWLQKEIKRLAKTKQRS
jgi:hypothetical protein